MQLRYRILNVFTVEGDRLSGNPLCVFEDGAALADAQMQALARQLNLSETTFILPATDREATARVRIFTPSFEMPFAGHPTLGTAHVVRALRGLGRESSSGGLLRQASPAAAPGMPIDRVTLEMKAGLVPVEARGDEWTLRAAKPPATRAVAATRAQLAAMLSLPADAIAGEPLWVSTGVEQLVIPLASAAQVRAAVPVAALMLQYGFSEARDEAMAYVWARDGAELLVRFFFTQHGAVIEDPATGSACANLGGYFVATGAALPLRESLSQGTQCARPSRLALHVDATRAIFVTGAVVELGGGTMTI